MPDRVTVGVVCSRGIGPARGGREHNEDNYLVCRGREARYRRGAEEEVREIESAGLLFAVADGMGGHADGELASTAAVQALSRLFRRGVPADPERHLHRFVLDAHRRLRSKVGELGPVRMGTTLTVAWVLDGRAYWVHVGDSRLYHWRDGQFRRLTRDHTRAEFARRDGRSVGEDGHVLAQSFVFGSRGMGDDREVRVDLGIDTGLVDLRAGDRLVLCSDGLTGFVEDARIASLLTQLPEPQPAAVGLMERSLASGSDDNVTVLVVRVDEVAERSSGVEDTGDETTLVPL